MDKDQFLMELYEEAYETEISDEQMEKLKKIANEDDSFNKAMVAKILVNSESEEGKEILLKLTHDKDSLVRAEACDSLCIGETMETYERLKKLSEKDRIGLVRGYATISLSDISEGLNMQSDTIEFLESRLDVEKVVFVRINLYTALYKMGKKEYLKQLVQLFDVPRYQNRGAVANSLGEILDESNEEEIFKILLEHKKTEKSYLVVSIIENVIKEYEEYCRYDDEYNEKD